MIKSSFNIRDFSVGLCMRCHNICISLDKIVGSSSMQESVKLTHNAKQWKQKSQETLNNNQTATRANERNNKYYYMFLHPVWAPVFDSGHTKSKTVWRWLRRY